MGTHAHMTLMYTILHIVCIWCIFGVSVGGEAQSLIISSQIAIGGQMRMYSLMEDSSVSINFQFQLVRMLVSLDMLHFTVISYANRKIKGRTRLCSVSSGILEMGKIYF